MDPCLDRVILGGQAEGVVAHRVQHTMSGAAVEVGDGVAHRIFLQVTDVRLAARVGEHLEHIGGGVRALPGERLVRDLPRALPRPHRLPAGLHLLRVIATLCHRTAQVSGRPRTVLCSKRPHPRAGHGKRQSIATRAPRAAGYERTGRGGAEHPSLGVERLHREIARPGGGRNRRLEAASRRRGERRERTRAGAAQQAPLGDGGGAVPARVGGQAPVGACADGELRRLRGSAGPGKLEHRVGLVGGGEMGVEQKPAFGGEFREVGFLTPADEPVAAGEGLEVSLARGQQRLGVSEARDERGGHVGEVKREHDHTRLGVHPRGAAVVEEGDRAVRLLAGVVLVGGARARSHREARMLAAESPDDLAPTGVDVVGGRRIARVDEQIRAVL